MPRKRRTKAVSRAKPKAPDGNEGEGLTLEERREKLQLFLQDFDNEVKNRIELMRKQAIQLCDSVSACYRMELMKLPKNIREMKRSEFLKQGGNASDIQLKATDEIVDSIANSIDQKVAKSSEKPSRTMKKTVMVCETISEEDSSQDEGPIQTTVKKGRRGKAVLNDSTNMPPPSTQRTRRASKRCVMKTPLMKGGPSRAGWETPLVTPKFDPRLPMTPGMLRKPKPGERVMSMAGSPLSTGAQAPGVTTVVPVGKGQIIHLDPETELENLEIPHLDSETIDNIQKLQDKLSAILKHAHKVN